MTCSKRHCRSKHTTMHQGPVFDTFGFMGFVTDFETNSGINKRLTIEYCTLTGFLVFIDILHYTICMPASYWYVSYTC